MLVRCCIKKWKERKQGSEKMNDKQKSHHRCWSVEPPTSVEKLHHYPPWRSARPLVTQRKTFYNENKPLPFLDLCPASCAWKDTGERNQFQQRADRFWTTAGMEWLVVRRMSQASCAELALDDGGVLNGFILHYYGQCEFAYEGASGPKVSGLDSSVSGSQLRLMLTSVSWNYLV